MPALKETKHILVIDDDSSILTSLRLNLEFHAYDVHVAQNSTQASELLLSVLPQVVICDLSLPDVSGFDVIKNIRGQIPQCGIVAMSGLSDSETSRRALESGADICLVKPFEVEQLLKILSDLLECEVLVPESAPVNVSDFSGIIACSEGMLAVLDTVRRLAAYNTTVLVTGESGTGKELVAKAIHQGSSRKTAPFIAINCGAIPENLMESELFGHRKGSFTDAVRDKSGLLEEARGGTVFLDEIGEMPLHLQVKLLRALQERKIRPVGAEDVIDIDVRIIAATLRDLENDVLDGRFREDLFYRLNVVTVHIPPLRERPADVKLLIEHFLLKHGSRLGISGKKFGSEAMKCLLDYTWKGNVRELENCVERALVLSDGDTIGTDVLPAHIRQATAAAAAVEDEGPDFADDNLSIKQRGRALEISLIKRALKRTNGNRTQAARVLEISHRALLYKLKEYGLGQ